MIKFLIELLFVAVLLRDGAGTWGPAQPPPGICTRPTESGGIAAGAKGAPKQLD